MALYGRDDLAWDELARAGLEFLLERARLEKLTSYTELNATLIRRTGLSGFDFSRADERAAMGHLLYLIVELNRQETGLMISALVSYLDANDAAAASTRTRKTWECFSETPRPCKSWSSGPGRSRHYMSTTRRSGQHERLRSLTRRTALRPSSSATMGLRTAPNWIFCAAPAPCDVLSHRRKDVRSACLGRPMMSQVTGAAAAPGAPQGRTQRVFTRPAE